MATLSTKKGTIGKIIYDNLTKINAAKDKVSLISTLETLLKDSKNKDKDSFLGVLVNKKSFDSALTFVYDYMMKGDGLGVI